jgi:hypothetical protein
MVSITGLNIFPSTNLPKVREPDAIEALLQNLNTNNGASGAADRPTSGAGAGTNAPTGFTAAPRLSADVIGALIGSQSQQGLTSSTSGTETAGQATNLSGASAVTGQPPASSDSSSGPPTLQQIAGQFDLHHLTHQQEEQLQGELVSSGALSEKDGFAFFAKTVLADAFNSQHYRIINGQLVATTPSPPGTIIGNDAPGGPQYDVVQRFQQSVAADQSFGDSANAAKDQKILDVLNQLDSIRNGGTA